jgi:pyridoxamine 5'-phosphate oxidase
VPEEERPDPLAELGAWIEEAREAGSTHPAALSFATVDGDGRPSARTVTLKRIEPDALLLTSALWTRKARDIEANPHVSLLFFWPELGRQVHVAGTATIAESGLADELFAERDDLHQLQTIVSRQGSPIEEAQLEERRARLVHLAEVQELPPTRPDDWGVLRIHPEAIELWAESPDRLHERRLFTHRDAAWHLQRLAP